MSYATPRVNLITKERRQLKVVVGRRSAASVSIVRPVQRLASTGSTGSQADRGEQERTGDSRAGLRLLHASHCELDVLICRIGYRFELRQHGVVEDAPPVAVRDVWCTRIRRAAFLEASWNRRHRLMVLRADHATCQRQKAENNRSARQHVNSPSARQTQI